MFTYTTENKGTYVIVKLYKKGHRGIFKVFNVPYNGDWNEVDYEIENAINFLTKNN